MLSRIEIINRIKNFLNALRSAKLPYKSLVETTEGREFKKARLILNPKAGWMETNETLEWIVKSLKRKNPKIRLTSFLTKAKGDAFYAAKEAIQQGDEIVIAAGGDGTVHEVINGLVGSEVTLGIIPLGTANVFAQEIDIPADIEQACNILKSGEIRRIDLGKTDDHYFIWIAAVGLDAQVANKVNLKAKKDLNVFSYFFVTVGELLKLKPHQMRINIDDKVIDTKALSVIVGNAASYDGDLKISAKESLGDGYFDVCIYRKLDIFSVIRGIFWFIIGRYSYYRDVASFDVVYYKAKRVAIETNPPAVVHVDGEVIGKTPVKFTIVPKAISIILPKSSKPAHNKVNK